MLIRRIVPTPKAVADGVRADPCPIPALKLNDHPFLTFNSNIQSPRALKNLVTYCCFLFTVHGVTQPSQGNLKIENITSPEGFQLPYVYDVAQDSTGLYGRLNRK